MGRTERVELTTLCLIYKENHYLLQDRVKDDWKGFTLPGGRLFFGSQRESFKLPLGGKVFHYITRQRENPNGKTDSADLKEVVPMGKSILWRKSGDNVF